MWRLLKTKLNNFNFSKHKDGEKKDEPCPYEEFLFRLGQKEGFVFFPKTPETLSRIIVEARMMDMKVITNNLPGAVKEPWFKKRGTELIDIMREKRKEISQKVINIFEE